METNPKNIQMMHLAGKDFKAVTINMFKELQEMYKHNEWTDVEP